MKKQIRYPALIFTFILLLQLSACRQEEPEYSYEGYWYTVYDFNNFKDYLTPPYFWFYSSATKDVDFLNSSATGELLTVSGKWIPINVSWDDEGYMTMTNLDGNVLLAGDCMIRPQGITFNVRKNNVYEDVNVYLWRTIDLWDDNHIDYRIRKK